MRIVSNVVIDPKVIAAIERRGFRNEPSPDPEVREQRWYDECGHLLTDRQLAEETADSIDELIDWLHHK